MLMTKVRLSISRFRDFWTKNLLRIEVKAQIHPSRDCITYKELSPLFNDVDVIIICVLHKFYGPFGFTSPA